ncbi:YhdT family protein [Bacillus sp. FJAT-50079]|uniref:YhdT family protein n=1 Tax=Bacillus sp. FJAT-50079 TaxID=2833577 RepID=UPI001BCA5629|nr:YhdT family protein [Bacillus sp. FJAT-50079]MBS4209878.1 YhdT family protein [Bacillus sp. FJAT-50079]
MKQSDRRHAIAHREAIMGIALVIVHFIWWYGFAYGLGKKPVEEYTYVFGFPAWFFYSCIVGFIFMVILVITVVKLYFKEVPFEPEKEETKL